MIPYATGPFDPSNEQINILINYLNEILYSGEPPLVPAIPVPSSASPNVSLLVNGVSNITLHVGDAYTYTWFAPPGELVYTSFYVLNGGPAVPWIANSQSGSLSFTALSDYVGVYNMFFIVISNSGIVNSSEITITIIP